MSKLCRFRTKYEPRPVGVGFEGVVSMTDPQYLKECDIETIIRTYGVLPRPDPHPLSVDVSEIGDFASALRLVQDGLDQFAAVPSDIRSRFGNDPVSFYRFVTDTSNGEELVKLGLAERRQVKRDTVELLESIEQKLSSSGTGEAQSSPAIAV